MTLTARGSIGDNNSVAHATDNASATAGGTGDATEVVGQIVDRSASGYAQSVLLAIAWKAALTAAKTLGIAIRVEHGNDSALSDTADYFTVTSTVVGTGAGTKRGVFGNDIDLGGAKRYIRVNFTPDLSASGTDTAELASVLVFAQS